MVPSGDTEIMITVTEPETIHTLRYLSSGSDKPERRLLEISLVHYSWEKKTAPCFLITADLQGREQGKQNRLLGEQVAEEVALLQELGQLPSLDFCLLCGDFYDYPDCHKRGGTSDVTSVLNAFATLAPHTLAVLGNHDEVTPDALDSRVTILDGTETIMAGLRFGHCRQSGTQPAQERGGVSKSPRKSHASQNGYSLAPPRPGRFNGCSSWLV